MHPVTTRNRRFAAAAATLAALAALAASPALAVEPGVSQRTVSYADLDLTRAADVQTLQGRLDRAMGAVCETWRSGPLSEMAQQWRCLATARTSVQPALAQAVAVAKARRGGPAVASIAVPTLR